MYLKYVYNEDTSRTCIDCLRIYQDINHSELERFDAQRKADFLEMLKGFVHNQVYPKFLDFLGLSLYIVCIENLSDCPNTMGISIFLSEFMDICVITWINCFIYPVLSVTWCGLRKKERYIQL